MVSYQENLCPVHTNKFQRKTYFLVELTHYHPRLALIARLNLSQYDYIIV